MKWTATFRDGELGCEREGQSVPLAETEAGFAPESCPEAEAVLSWTYRGGWRLAGWTPPGESPGAGYKRGPDGIWRPPIE
jgi:hypothetical protein